MRRSAYIFKLPQGFLRSLNYSYSNTFKHSTGHWWLSSRQETTISRNPYELQELNLKMMVPIKITSWDLNQVRNFISKETSPFYDHHLYVRPHKPFTPIFWSTIYCFWFIEMQVFILGLHTLLILSLLNV